MYLIVAAMARRYSRLFVRTIGVKHIDYSFVLFILSDMYQHVAVPPDCKIVPSASTGGCLKAADFPPDFVVPATYGCTRATFMIEEPCARQARS
jgi:hypothetical protein